MTFVAAVLGLYVLRDHGQAAPPCRKKMTAERKIATVRIMVLASPLNCESVRLLGSMA